MTREERIENAAKALVIALNPWRLTFAVRNAITELCAALNAPAPTPSPATTTDWRAGLASVEVDPKTGQVVGTTPLKPLTEEGRADLDAILSEANRRPSEEPCPGANHDWESLESLTNPRCRRCGIDMATMCDREPSARSICKAPAGGAK